MDAFRFPIVVDFNKKISERIFGGQLPTIVLFTNESDDNALNVFKHVADQKASDIYLATAKMVGSFGSKLAEFLGVSARDALAVRILQFNKGDIV